MSSSSVSHSLRINSPSVAQTLASLVSTENRARLSTLSPSMRDTMRVTKQDKVRAIFGRGIQRVSQVLKVRKVIATAMGALEWGKGTEKRHIKMNENHLASLGWRKPGHTVPLFGIINRPRMMTNKEGYTLFLYHKYVVISSPEGWMLSLNVGGYWGRLEYSTHDYNHTDKAITPLGRMELDEAIRVVRNEYDAGAE